MHFELAGKPTVAQAAPSIDDLRRKAEGLPSGGAPAATDNAAAAPSLDDLRKKADALTPSPAAPKPNLGPLLAGPGRYSGTPGTPTAPAEMPPAPPGYTPPPTTTGATGGLDDYGRPLDPNAPLPDAVQRIGGAMAAGYKDTAPILGPVGQNWLDTIAPWANPVFSGIDIIRGGANALSSGAVQGAYEAGSLWSPDAARALATLAITAPAEATAEGSAATTSALARGAMREGTLPGLPAKPPNFLDPAMVAREAEIAAPAITPSALRRATLRQLGFSDVDIDAFTPAEADRIIRQGKPTAEAPPAPKTLLDAARRPETAEGDEASADTGAQPAGAQVTPSGAVPEPTMAEKQRALQADIQETVRDRAQKAQQSGGAPERDDTPYVTNVPGGTLEPRPESERNLSYQASIDHKDQIFRSPTEYKEPYDKLTKRRNDDMVNLLKQDAGDDVVTAGLRDERKKVAPDAFGAWRGEQAVDAQPLVDQIDELLKSPEGKRDAIKNTFTAVRAKFYDDAGNLETMPSMLFGVDKHISDLLDKGARPTDREGNDAAAVKRELLFLQGAVRNLMGDGAPNFAAWRQAYRDASQEINQKEFLQRYQVGGKKLTGADGMLQESKLNQMLTDIYNDRNKPGVKLAKSLTDEQIQNIVNVRNEVAARQNLDQRMKVPGPATFQMLSRSAETGRGPLGTLMAMVPGAAVEAGLHTAAAVSGNPLLHFIAPGVGPTLSLGGAVLKNAANKAALRRLAQMDAENRAHLLSQPPYPPNPLAP